MQVGICFICGQEKKINRSGKCFHCEKRKPSSMYKEAQEMIDGKWVRKSDPLREDSENNRLKRIEERDVRK